MEKLTNYEKNNFVFDEERDYEILEKCKALEKKKLTKEDKKLIKVIKIQLKEDWRKTLLIELNKLMKKYKAK
jgi:hypothetical protein